MAPITLPSRDRVSQLLHYAPDTGELMWLPRPVRPFPDDGALKSWNAKYAGTQAGSIGGIGHRYIRIEGHTFMAHRLAWLIVHGEPVPIEIDHIDRDRANNRITNLRAATHSQNGFNVGVRSNNTTGIVGVSLHSGGKFLAKIRHQRQTIYLGLFPTLEEAAEARRSAEARLFGDFVPLTASSHLCE